MRRSGSTEIELSFRLGAGRTVSFVSCGPTHAAVRGEKFVSPMSQPKADPLNGRIFTVRNQRVILDADLARLYGVPTFRFNEAVKRNAEKFPEDFRFRLTKEEFDNLISQFAISSADTTADEADSPISSQSAMTSQHGGHRKLPWAFTEHGCLMAATVLNSPRAVQMSLYVIRAFVRMREALTTNATILKRLADVARSAKMAWRSAA